jgi:hypothetical protein
VEDRICIANTPMMLNTLKIIAEQSPFMSPFELRLFGARDRGRKQRHSGMPSKWGVGDTTMTRNTKDDGRNVNDRKHSDIRNSLLNSLSRGGFPALTLFAPISPGRVFGY